MGVDLEMTGIPRLAQLPDAFVAFQKAGVGAVVVAPSPIFAGRGAEIAALAHAHRIPTIADWRFMAEAGCLLSYGANVDLIRQRAAQFVVRILAGEKPSTMAMEQPTVFEFVLNQRTQKSLGVTLPPAILARIDEVIE
jgi:putative ABC transport system substrate-binding protein